MNKHRFDNIRLKTKTVGARATPEGIQVQFEGRTVPRAKAVRPGAASRGPHAQRQKIAADKGPAWP